MLLHVYSVYFFSAFLDLQSIRDDEATTSKELIFFNALTDVPITSRKTRVEVANSGKTMMFYESIQTFPKISENSWFRSFELLIIRKDSCGPWHFEVSRFDCIGLENILMGLLLSDRLRQVLLYLF